MRDLRLRTTNPVATPPACADRPCIDQLAKRRLSQRKSSPFAALASLVVGRSPLGYRWDAAPSTEHVLSPVRDGAAVAE